MSSGGAATSTVMPASSSWSGSQRVELGLQQRGRHEVVARRHPLEQHPLVTGEVDEARRLAAAAQHLAVGPPERRAAHQRRASRGVVLTGPRGERPEPRQPVLVGQRVAGRHLGDVGLRVEVVALGEVPAEPLLRPPAPPWSCPSRTTPMNTRWSVTRRPSRRYSGHGEREDESPSVVSMTVQVLQRRLLVHPEEPADQPEAGVVDVGEHGRAGGDRDHEQRQLDVAEVPAAPRAGDQSAGGGQRHGGGSLGHPEQRGDDERLQDQREARGRTARSSSASPDTAELQHAAEHAAGAGDQDDRADRAERLVEDRRDPGHRRVRPARARRSRPAP